MELLNEFVYERCIIHDSYFCNISHFIFCLSYTNHQMYDNPSLILKTLETLFPTIKVKPDMEIIEGLDLDRETYRIIQFHFCNASST